MNFFDVMIVVGGLLLGYLVVSMLMGKRTPIAPQPAGTSLASTPKEAEPEYWHRVLNVAPDATLDEIRAAHAALMRQYEPEPLAAMGPELRELAECKSTEITQAYQRALAARGEAA